MYGMRIKGQSCFELEQAVEELMRCFPAPRWLEFISPPASEFNSQSIHCQPYIQIDKDWLAKTRWEMWKLTDRYGDVQDYDESIGVMYTCDAPAVIVKAWLLLNRGTTAGIYSPRSEHLWGDTSNVNCVGYAFPGVAPLGSFRKVRSGEYDSVRRTGD